MAQANSQYLQMQQQKHAIQAQIQIQQRALEYARRENKKQSGPNLANQQRPRTIEEWRKMNQTVKDKPKTVNTERELFNQMLEQQRQERRRKMSEFVQQKQQTLEQKKLRVEARGQQEKIAQINSMNQIRQQQQQRLNEVKYKKIIMSEDKRRFMENQCKKEIMRNLERGQQLQRQQQVNEREERELQRMKRQLDDLKKQKAEYK